MIILRPRTLLSLLALLCCGTGLRAQSAFSWQLVTDTATTTSGFHSIGTANGDIVTIHASFTYPPPVIRRFHFKRFNADGILLAAADYQLANDPMVTELNVVTILELPNGDIALCGYASEGGIYMRLSAQGQILVAKHLEGDVNSASFSDMRLWSSSTIIAAGTFSISGTRSCYLRLDLNGTVEDSWSDEFQSMRGHGIKLLRTHDMGILFGGLSYPNVGYEEPYTFVQKMNAVGEVQWVRNFSLETHFRDMVELPSGACIVLVNYQPQGSYYSPMLVKFSATGDLLHAEHISADSDMLESWQVWHLTQVDTRTLVISGDNSSGHLLARADTNGVVAPVATNVPHGDNGLQYRSEPVRLSNGDMLYTGWRDTAPGADLSLARVPVGGAFPCDTTAVPLYAMSMTPAFDTTYVRSEPLLYTVDLPLSLFTPITWDWTPLALCLSTNMSDVRTPDNGISVFPNPASTTLQVTATFTVRQLELVDLTGTVVQRWQTPLPEGIPVSGLAEGMYMLRGIGASETLTQRVVVAH